MTVFLPRGLWPNPEDGRKNKQDGGYINFHGPIIIFSLFLFALLQGSFPQPLNGAGDPKPGTILVRGLNMRAGPGRHNPVIATLSKGSKVLVLSYEGDWVRVLHKDQAGFIMNLEHFVRIDEPGGNAEAISKKQKAEAAAIHRKLSASMEKIAAITEREAGVIDALDRIERELSRDRQTVATLTAELKEVGLKIKQIEDSYRKIEHRAEVNERYVAGRLIALYKVSWLGNFHVLASSDSMFDFFFTKRSLEKVLSADGVVMEQLARDKAKMLALVDQLSAKKNEKRVTAAELTNRIDTMKAEQASREALLAEIRGKKSLQLAAAESLKRSARDLDRTMASFRLDDEPKKGPPLTVVEKPFASLKGLLMMPVKGRIVSFFGLYQDSKFNVTHFQSGIHIRADKGEPIRAVHSGRTLFSSWFKGFGNMLIIDHGDHYYTVYAHLEEQFKSKGDPVEAGEVIATVGDTGALAEAGLHFEVRHHGKPMNPLNWIKKG